ncbi:MAG: DUF5615 family PIN-like protein, partial [Candidatus Methylophosphatis roskildensis]
MLRFLADESCDFAAVRALRAERFDVLSVAEIMSGAQDERVIELALRESRILLTEDKDFGQLVFAAGRESVGVVLIRFAPGARAKIGDRVLELVVRSGNMFTNSPIVSMILTPFDLGVIMARRSGRAALTLTEE